MSNTPKRAFGSSAKSKRKEVNLDLSTARQMLPLVRSIVKDIIEKQTELQRLHPEQDSLDRHRHRSGMGGARSSLSAPRGNQHGGEIPACGSKRIKRAGRFLCRPGAGTHRVPDPHQRAARSFFLATRRRERKLLELRRGRGPQAYSLRLDTRNTFEVEGQSVALFRVFNHS